MSIFARIQSGQVAELFTPPPDVSITECFEAGLTWVDVTARPDVAPGWTYDGSVFAAPIAPPVPPLTAAQLAAAALAAAMAAGIALTSTGNPALNATYALDSISQGQINNIGIYANAFGYFPDGGPTGAYPDANSVPHVFTLAQFVAFFHAVASLVFQLQIQAGIMAAGGTPVWPPQTATIA